MNSGMLPLRGTALFYIICLCVACTTCKNTNYDIYDEFQLDKILASLAASG